MDLYLLQVFRHGESQAVDMMSASRASEALDLVQELLRRHPDCHRIRVYVQNRFLFAVDCEGASVVDD